MFKIRKSVKSDESFIYSTWLKGLYYGNAWFKEIDQDIYFKNYHQVIERIINKPSSSILCACLEDDQDTLLSFCVYETIEDYQVLHWVFTKFSFRRSGIAKALLPNNIKFVSSLTNIGKSIKHKDWKFNPFLI